MAEGQKAGNGGGASSQNVEGPRRAYVRPETVVRGKTEQGYSHELARAVLETEAKRRNERWEYATVIDGDGNEVLSKTSYHPNHVELTPKEAAKLENNIFTHNHPEDPGNNMWWKAIGSPFSPADIVAAVQTNAREIRAVTPNYTFSLKRPKGGWGVSSSEVQRTLTDLMAAYQIRDIPYELGKGPDKMRERSSRAQIVRPHQALRELSKRWGWDYTKKKG